jgi:type IV secretory pathway VirB3-like protein
MMLLGVERRLFFFILMVAFLLFHLSGAIVPAFVLFGVLWVFAKAATQHDPQLLRIVINSSRFAVRYDPALWQNGRGRRG